MGIASILIIGLILAGIGEDFQERTKLNFPFKTKKEITYKFSAQGITGRYLGIPLRAAPSAGALYPFEIYIYAQNVFLESVSLGLGSCVVGAFFDDMINRIIGVDGKRESAIYIQTIGRPR